MDKEFWPMWILMVLFIAFAAICTNWAGLGPYALFWVVCGVAITIWMVMTMRKSGSQAE